MKRDAGADARLIAAWRTNHRATVYLVQQLPPAAWWAHVPGVPRLTVGMIAAHIHNVRCRWVRSLGAAHGVDVPQRVDPRRAGPSDLVGALSESGDAMVGLIELAIAKGGRLPRASWQNFPPDLEHFLAYFAAHEGHHRGQLCLVVRQLGQRLPRNVSGGLWQWTTLSRGRD